ncbi:MAG: EutN/CcmL family microcompartment protein [Chloroflexota bacterium]|jgi:ethanolamine utilization protein EutN
MQIARVIGSAVSTVKDAKLTGLKLLIVQKATPDNQVHGDPFIAADTVGAGSGELVMLVEGSSARQTLQTSDSAVDAVIIGILDSLEVEGSVVFRKC